ncbi:MAG: ethanolamine ammonia-lyase subunit EutC [Pseudomonadota bacterium]
MKAAPRDPWHGLSSRTPARIAIGRAGGSLPTREVLEFSMAHARARDAVHAAFDRESLAKRLAGLNLETIAVDSQATDRAVYLRRPDLGRRLSQASRTQLSGDNAPAKPDLTIVVGDGLSATAVNSGAFELIAAFLPHVAKLNIKVGPIVLATGTRVALGDEIGALTGAELVAVIIGERPGLSAADNLSVYLTYAPSVGRNDAERNCISNIGDDRLSPVAAAANLAWLINAARERKLTGVALKDESDALLAIDANDSGQLT